MLTTSNSASSAMAKFNFLSASKSKDARSSNKHQSSSFEKTDSLEPPVEAGSGADQFLSSDPAKVSQSNQLRRSRWAPATGSGGKQRSDNSITFSSSGASSGYNSHNQPQYYYQPPDQSAVWLQNQAPISSDSHSVSGRRLKRRDDEFGGRIKTMDFRLIDESLENEFGHGNDDDEDYEQAASCYPYEDPAFGRQFQSLTIGGDTNRAAGHFAASHKPPVNHPDGIYCDDSQLGRCASSYQLRAANYGPNHYFGSRREQVMSSVDYNIEDEDYDDDESIAHGGRKQQVVVSKNRQQPLDARSTRSSHIPSQAAVYHQPNLNLIHRQPAHWTDQYPSHRKQHQLATDWPESKQKQHSPEAQLSSRSSRRQRNNLSSGSRNRKLVASSSNGSQTRDETTSSGLQTTEYQSSSLSAGGKSTDYSGDSSAENHHLVPGETRTTMQTSGGSRQNLSPEAAIDQHHHHQQQHSSKRNKSLGHSQRKQDPTSGGSARQLAASTNDESTNRDPEGLSFCGKFAKLLLFVTNVLFWSAGIALGAWGILSLVDDHKYNLSQLLVFEPNSKMSLFQLLSWSYITLGCATILVGFCGCSAIFKNNRWILGLYIFLILAIFALDLATGLLAIIFQERLVANVRLRLANKLRSDYGVQASFTAAIDYIQTRYECCGLEGHFDYDQSLWRLQRLGGFEATVARTCCHLRNTFDDQAHVNPRPVNESMCQSNDVRFHQSYRYRKGCLDDLERLVRQKIWNFTIGCGAVGIVVLVSLLFATCFCRAIPVNGGSSSKGKSSRQIQQKGSKNKQEIGNSRKQGSVLDHNQQLKTDNQYQRQYLSIH